MYIFVFTVVVLLAVVDVVVATDVVGLSQLLGGLIVPVKK